MQAVLEDATPATGFVPTPAEVDLDPDGTAAWVAAAAPSSGTLTGLLQLDPASLSHDARIDALVGLERSIALLQARQQRLLAVMAADPVPADHPLAAEAKARNWIREEVACALRITSVTAAHRLAVAGELAERLPDTLDALESAEIGYLHARTLADATFPLDSDVASKVEARVLPRAGRQSVRNFSASVDRAVQSIAPRPAEERHADAMDQRRVVATPQPDGMAELWALLPADGARTIITALHALGCRVDADDPRTPDQRRADALVHLATTALHGNDADRDANANDTAATGIGRLPRWQRQHPSIHVAVALSTLLGLDEQPGDLAGHGPIPAGLARRLAADPTGTWHRLVTDEFGRLLDYGRSTYRPPTDLAELVIARDRTCRFPHCNRPAVQCQLDHRIRWIDGGTTCPSNMQALCLRHHTCKDEAGWHSRLGAGATITWTSPTGHHYEDPPPQLPIDHTTDPPRADEDPPPF